MRRERRAWFDRAPVMASISSISVSPRALVAGKDGIATAAVEIVRAPDDLGGPVPVQVLDLPDGATAESLTIAAGATKGTLTINAANAARDNLLADHGRGRHPGQLAERSTAYGVLATGGIASGILDPTFGIDGISTDFVIPTWARQADGTLLVENDPNILRLAADGTPTGFSTSAVPLDRLHVVRAQADGTLLAAGTVRSIDENGFAQFQGSVWRVEPNGELDGTFGQGGVAAPSRAKDILDATTDANGNILIIGVVPSGETFVSRLLPSGDVDQTFNGGQYMINRLGSPGLEIDQTAPLAGGGWLVAGGDEGTGVLVRMLATGELDPSFAQGGMLRPDGAHYLGISPQADGSFIALRSGVVADDADTNIDTYVEWFAADGSLVSSWQYAADDDAPQGWSLDPSGRPVVAISGSTEALVVRLANGTTDESFGNGGLMSVSDYLGMAAPIAAVTTDGQGRIMLTNAGATMRILP